MRAVVVHEFGPIDSHSFEDVPDPTPGPEEVLVDDHATTVTYGLGEFHSAMGLSAERKSIGKTVLTTGRDG